MSELKKYKIEKLIKYSNPFSPLYDEHNFLSSEEPCDELNISELSKKNIYPFSFNFKKKKVIFIETKKVIPHNDTAFFHEPLQLSAEYLIHVPFSEMIKLSSGAQNKYNNFIFIHHPGRCGSTLLHKILGSNPDVESFSEDLILDNLFWRAHYEKPSYAEVRTIYTCLLDLFMIQWGDSEKKIISQKMPAFSHHYVRMLNKMLPHSKHIYLSRHPLEIAISLENINRTFKALSRNERKDVNLTFKKNELLNYSDLEPINNDMFMKGGFGKYICKNIPPDMKSIIGPIDSIERCILRVLLIDSYYNSLKSEKIMYLDYSDLFSEEILFKNLLKFLPLNNGSHFNKDVYLKHSQTNETFQSVNTKYFDLTEEKKKEYSLFAENIRNTICNS